MNEIAQKLLLSIVFVVISSVITYYMQSHESSSSIFEDTIVNPNSIKETFSSIGGLEKIKQEIIANVITPLRYPQVFFSPRLKALHVSRGILLTGPPGVGKTLLARAIAKECNCNFLAVTAATLEDKYFGETSKKIEALFSTARKRAPVVMFFDEFDGLMRTRRDSDEGCQYSLKTQLLANLDGFEKDNAAVMVIAATNSSKSLDAAVRRRLPRVYNIALPNLKDRKQILALHARAEKVPEDTLDHLAAETEGFSGSDLMELYRAAASVRIQRECARPEFHVRAAAACAHPHTLPEFAKTIRRLGDDEWHVALQQVRASKTTNSFL